MSQTTWWISLLIWLWNSQWMVSFGPCWQVMASDKLSGCLIVKPCTRLGCPTGLLFDEHRAFSQMGCGWELGYHGSDWNTSNIRSHKRGNHRDLISGGKRDINKSFDNIKHPNSTLSETDSWVMLSFSICRHSRCILTLFMSSPNNQEGLNKSENNAGYVHRTFVSRKPSDLIDSEFIYSPAQFIKCPQNCLSLIRPIWGQVPNKCTLQAMKRANPTTIPHCPFLPWF